MRCILLIGLGLAADTLAIAAKTYTTWDCCKPACAWRNKLGSGVSGVPRVCDMSNNAVSNPFDVETSCAATNPGQGYLCDDYQPTPVDEYLSYGFATMIGNDKCCKCYQITWTSGAASGKSMIVQAINVGSPTGDVTNNDIIIYTPGGGGGPNSAGCKAQYGSTWGSNFGGVSAANDCANLPANLQGGCYWRFNWAKGTVNGWNANYQAVQCPSRLTSISGCSA